MAKIIFAKQFEKIQESIFIYINKKEKKKKDEKLTEIIPIFKDAVPTWRTHGPLVNKEFD